MVHFQPIQTFIFNIYSFAEEFHLALYVRKKTLEAEFIDHRLDAIDVIGCQTAAMGQFSIPDTSTDNEPAISRNSYPSLTLAVRIRLVVVRFRHQSATQRVVNCLID